MQKTLCWLLVFVCALVSAAQIDISVLGSLGDRDGDGIPDTYELKLGTNPNVAEAPEVIFTANNMAGESLTALDMLRIGVCSVGGNRFLWKAEYAAPVQSDKQVLHLYIDTDNQAETGRPNYGCEYMCSFVNGGTMTQVFGAANGEDPNGVTACAVVGNCLYLVTDLPTMACGYEGAAAKFTVDVLSQGEEIVDGQKQLHTAHSKRLALQVPLAKRPKPLSLQWLEQPVGMTRSYGYDMIREQLLATPGVKYIRYDKLESDGFQQPPYNFYQLGMLVSTKLGATLTGTAPKGRYHAGFLTYDTRNPGCFSLLVDGVVKGYAPVNLTNRRYWFYWLDKPIEFQGGEKVTVRTETSAEQNLSAIVFFPEPPPLKQLPYSIRHLSAYTAPLTPGTTTVSWLTEMPSAGEFQYGLGEAFDQTAKDPRTSGLHKVELTGLDPNREYTGRAVASRKDGSKYYSEPFKFRSRHPEVGQGRAAKARLPLRVPNETAVDAVNWLVTSGIPFPQGELGANPNFRLYKDEQEIPVQYELTAWWPDGSLKWALFSFAADVPAQSEAVYQLEYGYEIAAPSARKALASLENGQVFIDGARQGVNAQGDLVLADGQSCSYDVKFTDYPQTRWDGNAQLTLEYNGPVRAVVKSTRRLLAEDGTPLLNFETRHTFWRGSETVLIAQTCTVLGGHPLLNVESLEYLVPGLKSSYPVPFFQRTSREYVAATEVLQGQLDGTVLGTDMSFGMRDFWQNYPKGLASRGQGLAVQICPDFEAGFYDKFPFEKEGNHLYYYLLDGHYRFKENCSKTNNMVISQEADKARRDAAPVLNQRRLLAIAPPEWYCGSQVFHAIAPRNPQKFSIYEKATDKIFAEYETERTLYDDYGLMNFGDWYPERMANWGNSEYDTQFAMFMQFIRSGNPTAFFLGEQTELHNRDIDTVASSGAVLLHQMGHVGWYYDKSVPGTLGWPHASATVSHAWAEGNLAYYFLTGDKRSLEYALRKGDFFVRAEFSQPYECNVMRNPGWHLFMNTALLAATNSPYYLNGCRLIIDRVLEVQDKIPFPTTEQQRTADYTASVGGWTRMLYSDHCSCEPHCRGNANFMMAILLTGMGFYYDITGDEAVKNSMIQGAKYFVREFYSPQTRGFRYTQCVKKPYKSGVDPFMVEAIARVYRWTKDPLLLSPITEGMLMPHVIPPYGKDFSMYYSMAPRVLAKMEEAGLEWNAYAPVPENLAFRPPKWFAPQPPLLVQAEDFTGEGGGHCRLMSNRRGSMYFIVTYWNDAGHWLDWEFEVPEEGDFELVLHYGTGDEGSRRSLEIDGKQPCPAAADIAFPFTGGFGFDFDQWQYLTLAQDGKPVSCHLTKGKHTLRMTNLAKGLALDFIAIRPVK